MASKLIGADTTTGELPPLVVTFIQGMIDLAGGGSTDAAVADKIENGTLTQAALDAALDLLNVVRNADLTTALDALVAAAPGTLDTLNEIAAALGDDPNFATTITGLLAAKVPNTRQVNGHALSTDVTVTKADVGLGDADDTSDMDKPVSTAQGEADAAIDDRTLAYAENATETPTVAASAGAGAGVPLCTIVVPPSDKEVWIYYAGTVGISMPGQGTLGLTVTDFTEGLTGYEIVGSHPVQFYTNSVANAFAAKISSRVKVGPSDITRVFTLGVQVVQQGSNLAGYLNNLDDYANKSWIAARI